MWMINRMGRVDRKLILENMGKLEIQMHTESDENGLAIQKKFQVCGQSFQPIQCFLGPLMYPF